MLSQAQRATILELHGQGVGKREIARLLKVSRQSVRQVLQANSSAVPKIERAEKATPFRQQILELLPQCKGNLVRVHEELAAAGAAFSYQALTAFCRRRRNRANAHRAGRPLRVLRRAWKCSMTPRRTK